ncbi:energy-coupling factor transporter transmembrane component T family protein [Virgibacillus soli]|uniref:energy-coupling factor transporter transmembrane component T family protein n=1 Tax=Paracerasibacillus soli TaxID=480284 RepID=UPI0035EB5646
MTLYVDKESVIHRIDPITKLLYVFVSIAITYILPLHGFVLGVTVVSLLLLIIGKVLWKILPIIGISLILIISIIIVQGFFHPDNETILFSIGNVSLYKEGFSVALLLTLRVLNMLSAFGVLILTTKPDELVERLIKKGLSPKIGHVLLSIFQLIPQMQATMGKITDAQRSRGMETEGNLVIRMKAFFPLIGPVVLNSLNDTRERAIALEMRGFNLKGKKTFLNKSRTYRYQSAMQGFLCIVLISTILWRIFQ